MCQQIKKDYAHCLHVYSDVMTLPCALFSAELPCTFMTTDIPEIMWLETREPGKCFWCVKNEEDRKVEKDRKKRVRQRLDVAGDEEPYGSRGH
jgi:hypothetical protein